MAKEPLRFTRRVTQGNARHPEDVGLQEIARQRPERPTDEDGQEHRGGQPEPWDARLVQLVVLGRLDRVVDGRRGPAFCAPWRGPPVSVAGAISHVSPAVSERCPPAGPIAGRIVARQPG